ncbi:50S ribosome-binding GTPase [Candidatus Micrarchaeota archaeon]|nr:50S ribosome-binding GTPase [Candidatus Micrarchaeota archaeon]MBU1166231.1 50S ribosome-binding GTPase [Candidatus Micrarchaeota archaeon]MBU1886812.1 50S ribosome-binding GTPase [Candidatus Micrarchaeota archaeon]
MNEWEQLKKTMKGIDIVVELVDARDIAGTRIAIIERLAGNNRLVIIANKSDLKMDAAEGNRFISAKNGGEKDRAKVMKLIMDKTKKRPVKALFVGYPNVGKSSTINLLARKSAAKVAPVAGTTKNVQWIKINDELRVTDYRGVYPKHEKKHDLIRKGAINIESGAEVYAYKLAEEILESQTLRKWIEGKFDLSLDDAILGVDVLSIIATRRGFVIKGGELNIEEAAKILIRAMREAPEI